MKLLSQKMMMCQSLTMVCVGVFLLIAIFGITFAMKTNEHGNMSGCPFMSEHVSVCPMGAIEHIAKWQQLFTATLPQSNASPSIIFLLLAFISLFISARTSRISLGAFALSPPVSNHKPEETVFNHLVIAFSQGILNPRLYA